LGPLHEIWRKYRDQVTFAVVYIREAHPEDGWVIDFNRQQEIAIDDPTTDAERQEVAATCAIRLEIEMPVVVDAIDDRIANAYGALPDRLYLIGKGGHIAFQGAPGPFGFQPAELETAIEEELANQSA
jgi:hypothetical protein